MRACGDSFACTCVLGWLTRPAAGAQATCPPPRLPPVDRRHLLPGHLLHGCTVAGAGVPRRASTGTGGRCGRAALCAHGHAMPVTRLRARRLNRADALGSLTRPAAGATTADGTGKTASDPGLSAAGSCTSRSSTLSVFDNLRALLLKVVICCGCGRFVRVLTGF